MFNMFAPASSSRDGVTALQSVPYVLSREGYCNKTKLLWGSARVLYGKEEEVQVASCRCSAGVEERIGTGGKRAGPWSGHARRNLTCQGQ